MINQADKANTIFGRLAAKNLQENNVVTQQPLKTDTFGGFAPKQPLSPISNNASRVIKPMRSRQLVKPRMAKLNPENAENYEEQVAIIMTRIADYLDNGNSEGLVHFVTCWIDGIIDDTTGELDDSVKYELQNYSVDRLVCLVQALLRVLQ